MNEKNEKAHRYSLILVTKTNDKYYFDVKLGTFVKMYENVVPTKSSLQAIDFLTANFENRESLAKSYGILDEVATVYIPYQFKGEKRIAPVFNNEKWAEIAASFTKKELNFSDKNNLEAFNEVYHEIADLDSDFGEILVKNEKRMINLSPKTIGTIVGLRAHENAIRLKKQYGLAANTLDTVAKVNDIYSEDRYGFYQDLKKRMTKYREFRTVYLNYCKYTKANKDEKQRQEVVQKRKALIFQRWTPS